MVNILKWYRARTKARPEQPKSNAPFCLPLAKAWQPGEPAQSILRAMKRQRHRFLFTINTEYGRYGKVYAAWSACDKDTGRVLFYSTIRWGHGDAPIHDRSEGLSLAEAKWIRDEYLGHVVRVKARTARLKAATARKQLMSEYVNDPYP